jgi:hypothetical protein
VSDHHFRGLESKLMRSRKYQIALEYACSLRDASPHTSVFWIHAITAENFQRGYRAIADAANLPGLNDPATLTLRLVKSYPEAPESGDWLMIIGNADGEVFWDQPAGSQRMSHAASTNFETFIAQSAGGSLIITRRNKQVGLEVRGGALIDVPAMTTAGTER